MTAQQQASVDLLCDKAGKPRVPLLGFGSPRAALEAAGFYAMKPWVTFPDSVWLFSLDGRSKAMRSAFSGNVDPSGTGSFFAPFRHYAAHNGLFFMGSPSIPLDEVNIAGLSDTVRQAWDHATLLIISDSMALTCADAECVERDEEGNLHCATGPAAYWPDGSVAFALAGEPMPGWLFQPPGSMAAEKVFKETDLRRRALMAEHIGWEKLLKIANAKAIDHDEVFGTLFRLGGRLQSTVMVLKVTNRTAEPDGSFKTYYLTAHPELKPLPDLEENPLGVLGMAQELTARNAAASLLGLRGEMMEPELET